MPTSQEFKKAGARPPEDEEVKTGALVEDEEMDESEDDEESSEEEEEIVEKPLTKKEKAAFAKARAEAKVSAPVSDKIGDLIDDKRFSLRPKSQAQRDFYAKQPLVQCLIPRLESEPKDAIQSYNVNGYGFWIRKGVFQMVPQDVAQMIRETFGQDAQIVADHPYNLANNETAKKALR